MSKQQDYTFPLIDSVLLPSDFSEASAVAFYHALKAALIAKSKFTMLHVSPDMSAEWTDFPGVRETLERWGLLPKGSPKSAVPELGIDVRKVVARHDDPVKSVLHYLEEHPADLIVLATHHHEDRASWLRKSVSEPVARKSGQMTLFVPGGAKGFVSAQDGSVSLERILVPIAPKPTAHPALETAARLVIRTERPSGNFTTLYVGKSGDAPTLRSPEVPGWNWNRITKDGAVIDTILDTAAETRADLIVMSTDGRNGFLDALRGSHSERVLRRASCPILTVPEGSLAAGNF